MLDELEKEIDDLISESSNDEAYNESYITNYFVNKVLIRVIGNKPDFIDKDVVGIIDILSKHFKKLCKSPDVIKISKKKDCGNYLFPVVTITLRNGRDITCYLVFDYDSFTPGAAMRLEDGSYAVAIYPNFFDITLDTQKFILLHEIGHIRLGHVEWYNQHINPNHRLNMMKKGKVMYPEANADLYATLNGAKLYTILDSSVDMDYDKKYDYRATNAEMSARYLYVYKKYKKLHGFTYEDIQASKESVNLFQEYVLEDIKNPHTNSIRWIKGKNEKGLNPLVTVEGRNEQFRGRSEMIVIKDDEMFIQFKPAGSNRLYDIPGGGWEPNEAHVDAAIRETKEEIRVVTKDVKYVSSYLELFNNGKVPNWIKDNFSKEDQWNGCFTDLYIGKYDKKYTGNIDKEDQDSMIHKGKWEKVKDVFPDLNIFHQEAIKKYFPELVDEYTSEACKDLETARKFVSEVGNLAKKYDANYFIVTDGASGYSNDGSNAAAKNARNSQINWEKKYGFDPDEDWSKESINKESVSISDKKDLFDKFKSFIKGNSEYSSYIKPLDNPMVHETKKDGKWLLLGTISGIKNWKNLIKDINENFKYEDPVEFHSCYLPGDVFIYVNLDEDVKEYVEVFESKRSEWPDEIFGIPELRKYPMPDKKHTISAIKLFNHVDKKYEEELAKAILENVEKYDIDTSFVTPKNRFYKYLHENEEEMESTFESSNDYLEIYLEANTVVTHNLLTEIYPKIEEVLSTPAGDKKFKQLVETFVDRHSEYLHEPCPIHMIPFTDRDKEDFYSLFNFTEKELKTIIKNALKNISNSSFKLVSDNPIFTVFYFVVRYYHLKKDTVGVNTGLIIHALASYPSVFHKYFKHGADPGVMTYTAGHLTQKFIFKQTGHVFGALKMSIDATYKKHYVNFPNCTDVDVITYVQRIRNDQNSMIKKISIEYYKNYQAGNTITTQSEEYGTGELIDDIENDTSKVELLSEKIIINILTNGIDLRLVETAATMSQLSISELRLYLTKIMVDSKSTELEEFITAVLFIYLYDESHKVQDVKSRQFLAYGIDLFRRTNSNDKNVVTIKTLLNKWAEETGIYARFKREGTQISYKKGIFWYILLSIQLHS